MKKEEKKKANIFNRINFKNKKTLIIIGAILLVIIALLIFLVKDKNGNTLASKVTGKSVKVVESKTSKIEYETYDNELISLTIPKGWKVDTLGDYIHYTFKVYDPNNQDYQLFYNLKTEGYQKSEAAKNWQISNYGSNGYFSKMPVLANQTAEGFYNIFNELGPLNNTSEFTFPTINNFKVIENFGPTVFGGDLLRASYTSSNNTEVEGLFTATVYSPGTYYVNTVIWNFNSPKVDVMYLNVYNSIFITTPKDEFVNWEKVLGKCIGSLKFSDKFMTGFNSEEDSILNTVKANSKIYNEISDSIMSSWKSRNTTYDTISQKQSDATLGYERVYDTETGDIYKAYNGFTDDYTGSRYKSITDDMYSESISGYIEK